MQSLSLPVGVLFGVYLGLLTGVVPALVSWALAFVVRYVTDIQLPGFGVVVLALAIAGVQGGLLAFTDDAVIESIGGNPAPAVTAILVILMMALYAHAKGDAMGQTFPKRLSLSELRERSLSVDVVELVGGRTEVRVSVRGEVGDIEGYPPLSSELRTQIREGEWTFPGDLSVGDIEDRFADRLRTEFDLADVVVRMDERGRASVDAAPPLSGLSKRIPDNERAVSVQTLVPTGLARGDRVDLHGQMGVITGTVVSVVTEGGSATSQSTVSGTESPVTDGGTDDEELSGPTVAPTAAGGEGRLTVSVSRGDARTLLTAERPWVVVRARGHHREFELLSLLRRAGRRFRRLRVGEGPLDGVTLGAASVRDSYDVAILGVRHGDEWRFAPRGSTQLHAGDELFAVGKPDALTRFSEAVS